MPGPSSVAAAEEIERAAAAAPMNLDDDSGSEEEEEATLQSILRAIKKSEKSAAKANTVLENKIAVVETSVAGVTQRVDDNRVLRRTLRIFGCGPLLMRPKLLGALVLHPLLVLVQRARM